MKRENIERRENGVKQRWSVRESRVRGIEKDGEKKVANGRCLLMSLVTV